MDNEILASESITFNNRTYFFDFKRAANGTYYVAVTCCVRQNDGSFDRQRIRFFEEFFECWFEAMSSLFRTAGYQEVANQKAGRRPEPLPPQGIKSWDPECRPREKLLAQGRHTLAEAELVAILISAGSVRETAVDLAARILASVDFSLRRLAALSVEELCAFKGMGHAKACAILAAIELGQRLADEQALL